MAVYHFVDRAAPHVALADEAVELEGLVPSAAYLDGAQVLAICAARGVDALYPGYGFLSENAAFAEETAKAGVRFIGPSATVMRLMGDKIRSRELAAAAGVPTSPSVLLDDGEESLERAAEIGFPLLVKASAGGGGKGMKIVRDRGELAAQVALARGEAARYFGDARVYAERLLERPRHIEVQVLGDGKGNVIHLGDRECSIQRRYQKVVEEAPAENLAPALRTAIVEAALEVARAAKYENAGTVELILGEDGTFYFLEMNTRLQVEHPVTELVTGLDLVALQVQVAKEGRLPLAQDAVTRTGHAIEVRICAEEPDRDYRPATGRVGVLALPTGDGVRVDSGIIVGQEITPAFDSLLLKLVVFGTTREEARARLEKALAELVLLGVPTNIDWLLRLVRTPAFAAGRLHTGFLAEHADALAPVAPSPALLATALAAAALGDDAFRHVIHDVPEPYASMGAYRN